MVQSAVPAKLSYNRSSRRFGFGAFQEAAIEAMDGKYISQLVFGGPERIQLRTLTLIRWAAIIGQATALLVVHFGLGFDLPILPALAVVAASALFNVSIVARRQFDRLREVEVAGYLAFDVVQLAVLLFLTGGLQNPFAFLLLAPVAVAATVFSLTSTAILCGLALACITVLAGWHLPLPWRGPPPHLPLTYILGVWAALAIGILFFAAYTWRVAEEARRLSEALSATQLALAREQQLSAMGALAAAAAHELGSPLGTIALAASEIARDLPGDSPLSEDVSLLRSETARCRDILAELARNPAGDNAPFSRVPINAVVESSASRHLHDAISMQYDAAPQPSSSESPQPLIAAAPEIIHGLGSLIQNAVQFAKTKVVMSTCWSDTEIDVTIIDDGPGFSPLMLDRIGEPYLSMRLDSGTDVGDHMGLGIFIAKTLLSRTGARVEIGNQPGGGARVAIHWERAILEPDFDRIAP
jgi:two-component system sensor histidine kinase RegB